MHDLALFPHGRKDGGDWGRLGMRLCMTHLPSLVLNFFLFFVLGVWSTPGKEECTQLWWQGRFPSCPHTAAVWHERVPQRHCTGIHKLNNQSLLYTDDHHFIPSCRHLKSLILMPCYQSKPFSSMIYTFEKLYPLLFVSETLHLVFLQDRTLSTYSWMSWCMTEAMLSL